jgi:outer membrane lipoprotein-sorting protein
MVMKRMFALAATLLFASGAALASHCPSDVKAIDDALAKNPKLSEADMKSVKANRDAGDAAHKAGKHKEAEESLHKAMATLKMEHAKK